LETFKKWQRERRVFLIWMTIFSLIFFMFLPISLAFFPEFMKTSPFGLLTWAWIFAFLQVVMTWIIGWIYWVRAKHLDNIVVELKREVTK